MRRRYLCWMLGFCLWMGFSGAWAKQVTVLVLGDSISAAYGLSTDAGWVSLLKQRLAQTAPCWQVINASISGETTSGGLVRLPALMQQHHPQIVLIELGGNDGLQGLSPTLIKQNLVTLLTQSQTEVKQSFLLGIPVLPNYGHDYHQALLSAFRQAAAQTHAIYLTDILSGLRPPPSDDFQADGIHPSVTAQTQILANIWPQLAPWLTCESMSSHGS